MLFSLALIFISGYILGHIFESLKLPRLVGMLICGIVLGPYVLNLLDPTMIHLSADIRQIALIIILTRAGLSLDLEDLKQVGRPAILMSFIPACFEMFGTFLLAPLLFDLSYLDAAILGAVIASASPAVIVPRMIHMIEEGYGTDKKIPQLILASDSVDDMFNIVVFTALLAFSTGSQFSLSGLLEIPVSIFSGVLVGVLLGMLLVFIYKHIKMNAIYQALLLLSIAFLCVSFEDLNLIPFSGLLAVMCSGIVLAKHYPETAQSLSQTYSKLWFGAEILLFVLVGSSVDIRYVPLAGMRTIVLLVSVLSIRALGILLCLVGTDLTMKERIFCTFTGIPKATVQAAIGGIPLAMGLASGEIILAIAVMAILFTAPLGAFIIDNTYKKILTPHKKVQPLIQSPLSRQFK